MSDRPIGPRIKPANQIPANTINMTGRRFGKWTVLSYTEHGYWLCRCVCNAQKEVSGKSLREGRSRGCAKCQAPAHSKSKTEAPRRTLPDRHYRVDWSAPV